MLSLHLVTKNAPLSALLTIIRLVGTILTVFKHTRSFALPKHLVKGCFCFSYNTSKLVAIYLLTA